MLTSADVLEPDPVETHHGCLEQQEFQNIAAFKTRYMIIVSCLILKAPIT